MEIDEPIQEDVKMDDSYQRYLRLHAIVQSLKSTSISKTKDWYAEHNNLIQNYTKFFYDFSVVHPEHTDKSFREKCSKVQLLSEKLIWEFDKYGWFSTYDYLQLNELLIWVIDYVYDSEEQYDEMADLVSSLSVS
jgi:hypothetical protein